MVPIGPTLHTEHGVRKDDDDDDNDDDNDDDDGDDVDDDDEDGEDGDGGDGEDAQKMNGLLSCGLKNTIFCSQLHWFL